MRSPEPLPYPFDRLPFTVDQARRRGLSRGRSRAPDLMLPSRGIRVPAAADFDLLEQCRAHVGVTPRSFISHVTAAKLHGLFLPLRLEAQKSLDLSRRRGEPQPRRRNARGHNVLLGQSDLMVMTGVPVTTAAKTLLDLAPLLNLDELVVVVDQIVCAHDGICVPFKAPMMEIQQLRAYLEEHQGWRGMNKLRAAMELARVGADFPPETRLRLIIGRSPLPCFEPNIKLLDASGNALVQPDLACRKYRTCAEYDGGLHFTPQQQAKDHQRNYLTKSLGWQQVLLNKTDIQAGEAVVVTKLARTLKLAGWPDPQNLAGRSFQGLVGQRRGQG